MVQVWAPRYKETDEATTPLRVYRVCSNILIYLEIYIDLQFRKYAEIISMFSKNTSKEWRPPVLLV